MTTRKRSEKLDSLFLKITKSHIDRVSKEIEETQIKLNNLIKKKESLEKGLETHKVQSSIKRGSKNETKKSL